MREPWVLLTATHSPARTRRRRYVWCGRYGRLNRPRDHCASDKRLPTQLWPALSLLPSQLLSTAGALGLRNFSTSSSLLGFYVRAVSIFPRAKQHVEAGATLNLLTLQFFQDAPFRSTRLAYHFKQLCDYFFFAPDLCCIRFLAFFEAFCRRANKPMVDGGCFGSKESSSLISAQGQTVRRNHTFFLFGPLRWMHTSRNRRLHEGGVIAHCSA
jgi:hypothetical protein